MLSSPTMKGCHMTWPSSNKPSRTMSPSRRCFTHTEVSTRTILSPPDLLYGVSFSAFSRFPQLGQPLAAFPGNERFKSKSDQMSFLMNAGHFFCLINSFFFYVQSGSHKDLQFVCAIVCISLHEKRCSCQGATRTCERIKPTSSA